MIKFLERGFMFNKIIILSFLFIITSCGIQGIPKSKNKAEASLAEVTNQYKRRSDLIPNLAEVVFLVVEPQVVGNNLFYKE